MDPAEVPVMICRGEAVLKKDVVRLYHVCGTDGITARAQTMSTTITRTRDLPLDETRDFAALMLRLHADVRERHGLPPLPTDWTVGEHLRALRQRASLTDTGLLRARAPVVGRVVTSLRRVLWTLLKPLFYRQTEVNRDVLLALDALAREREQARHVHHVLSERIADLEVTVVRLRARVE